MKRYIFISIVSIILICQPVLFAFSADDIPFPVTDSLLQALGLDRDYHRCIAVADGDTLTLEGLGTVRFIGVDTPEKNHPKLPVQYMSREAGAFTEKVCLGQQIRLEYDPYDEDKRGRYGRVLGYVYLKDGTYLQEELIKNGFAVAYTKYSLDERRRDRLLEWEQEAKEKGIGLWKDDGFSEVLWILEQKHPLLQVRSLAKDHWEISFGNWTLNAAPSAELESNLQQLYSVIYEFSPRELRTRLRQLQYVENRTGPDNQQTIFVIGMAHGKWGIIYKNFALTRVLPGKIEGKLSQLSGWIANYSEEELRKVLLKNQYRFIPASKVNRDAQRMIAGTFLRAYKIRTTGKGTVAWDLAGDYIGRSMSVEGKITRTHNSGKACFLNFHNNWTRYFSLVIFSNAYHRFPDKPEEFYLNKTVRVKGKIKMYRGRPEMVLNRSDQIEVID